MFCFASTPASYSRQNLPDNEGNGGQGLYLDRDLGGPIFFTPENGEGGNFRTVKKWGGAGADTFFKIIILNRK